MAKRPKAQWLIDLLRLVEKHVDESTLAGILEQRGRNCIGATYINKAKNAAKGAGDAGEFFKNLVKVFPYLEWQGDKIYFVYDRCVCPHMKGFKGEVPPSYCYCSVGWVKEMLEQALDKPVEVKLESSVLRGGEACRLRVFL